MCIVFLLVSCNQSSDENTNEAVGQQNENVENNNDEVVDLDYDVNEKAGDINVPSSFSELTLEGLIYEKFPIIVQLKNENGKISGEVIYKKVGVPITLEGKISGNNMKLGELPPGKRGPIYSGVLTETDYKGTWYDSELDKEFPFDLKVTKSNFEDYHTMDVSGVYEIGSKGGEGGHAVFAVKQLNKKQLKFVFFKVGNAPAYNQGSLVGNAPLKGNIATFSDKGEEFQCVFDMKFSSTEVKLSSDVKFSNCGFGNNIYVDGTYSKKSSEVDLNKLAKEYGM